MPFIHLPNGTKTKVDLETFKKYGDSRWYTAGGKVARSKPGGKKGSHEYLHRLVANCPEGRQVSHKDGDSLNNLPSNLQVSMRFTRQKKAKEEAGDVVSSASKLRQKTSQLKADVIDFASKKQQANPKIAFTVPKKVADVVVQMLLRELKTGSDEDVERKGALALLAVTLMGDA